MSDTSTRKQALIEALEAHWDIEADFVALLDLCIWVEQHFHDLDVIPLPMVEGRPIDFRKAYLEAALIRYRRCFDKAQRGGLDVQRGKEVVGHLWNVHDQELIRRANHIVAHPVSAAHSSSIYIAPDLSISCSTQRPGVNKFDFTNVILLSEKWLDFVRSEIERLKKELLPLLTHADVSGTVFHVSPFGSGIDIQSHRWKRRQ